MTLSVRLKIDVRVPASLNFVNPLVFHVFDMHIRAADIDPAIVQNECATSSAATRMKASIVHGLRIFIHQKHLLSRNLDPGQ